MQPTRLHWQTSELELLPQRALWQAATGLLLVADLHLGKAESFQASGIPLPSDGDLSNLNQLLDLAAQLQPQRVVVLGDLIHSRLGLTAELRSKIRALPELLGCPLELIGGNHDQGSWLEGLAAGPPRRCGDLWLSHEPCTPPEADLLNVAGHVHPVAVLGQGVIACACPASRWSASSASCCFPPSEASPAAMPCRRLTNAG